MILPPAAREVIESGALAHLVTINRDGGPQIACVWVGLDGDEIVSGHLSATQQKLKNVARDPRVALSIEAPGRNAVGMQHYLVVHGRARVTEGGAPELLHQLAQVYVGPGTVFPPMADPPPGYVMHIAVDRIGGQGPWAATRPARAPAFPKSSRPAGRTSRGGRSRRASLTCGFHGSASGARAERARDLLGRRLAVERRPLARDAARGADQRLHPLGRQLLPPPRAGRARDRLVHQRPAEVVHARRAAPRRRPAGPAFTHETWTFSIHGWSASRPTACISSTSPNVGPRRARPRR